MSKHLAENIIVDEKIFDQLRSNNIKYSPEMRVSACAYNVLGESSRSIEKLLGIPAATIRYWMQCPWWTELKREVKKAYQEELDGKLTKIIHKAADELEDRLEKGNYVLNPKTGELVRVPLKSSELAKDALGIPFDKRALSRGDPTSRIKTETLNPEEMLRQLAEQFEKIVQRNEPRVRVIEGERIDEQFTNGTDAEEEVIRTGG